MPMLEYILIYGSCRSHKSSSLDFTFEIHNSNCSADENSVENCAVRNSMNFKSWHLIKMNTLISFK